ncbi:MAG: hypothetical protein A2X40_00040 [Elusimicrobia bacterium GWC2_65_9]|nr:MAG: hypothetical protein A2X40_00040 [Elusimicrobia bacterium GWC2_65_9]
MRAQLLEEPDGKARQDLLSALDSLEAGATSAQPQQRQAWIDSHLGELNAAVRTLGADAPARTARKAARQAAALNNRAERWEEARAFAEQALSFDPEDHDALISRSQANSRLGEYARAFADADRVARVAPDAAAAYTARACASYGLGNYLQAIEDARKALALDPEDKTAFSIMKLSEGRTRAVPPSEQGRTRLADSVEREYHGMIQQLNEVEERRLTPVESPSARGVQRLTSSASSKLSVKDYGGAIEEADKALALDPADPQALYYRAVAHNLIGEYGSAARDATRGLIAAPSDWAMRDARAWAYNHMGRIREAIADSQHALELNPRDAYAFANRAFANEQRGDFTAMAEDYKAAAELSPQFEPAYRDSARRHGLDPKPIARERGAARFVDLIPARVRSFMVVLFASLLGGLLIALGVLHVVTGIKEREANAAPPVPATGLEAGYEIGKAIGQGGMGVVYEAVDRKLRRPVAVKMLRGEFQLDETAKVRFIEEARTVAELRHPAIVDIHAIIEDERGVSLVFERLEGRTLDEILAERRRLPLSEVKDILEPVCSGLSYAHAHDVVHRDLKPSNIMILKGGGVKLLDFGISRHAARAGGAATQTVTGTPHYMAPEQEYGSVRKENDVFSLGAVLYEMVTGARPYEGSCQTKLAKAYTLASHRAPDVSLALDALIDRALEPDADKRIPSPAEFWKQLNAVPEAPEPARAVYPAYAR